MSGADPRKAGVYLLARLSPALGGTDAWVWLLAVIGIVTMAMGAYLALPQSDIKRILAYATVSVLGMLVLLIGIGTQAVIEAATVYLCLPTPCTRACCFSSRASWKRDRHAERQADARVGVGDAAHRRTAGIAALSMAGVPPLLGYVGKEMLYEATLHASPLSTVLTGAALFASSVRGDVGYCRISPLPRRHDRDSQRTAPETGQHVGRGGRAGRRKLALRPVPLLARRCAVSPAVGAALGQPTRVAMKLWHGFTPTLSLRALTLAMGLAVYASRNALRRLHAQWQPAFQEGPEWAYSAGIEGVRVLAAVQTGFWQSGYLRYYLLMILLLGLGMSAYALLSQGELHGIKRWPEARFYEVALAMRILAATVTGSRSSSRVDAVAALGVVGYSIALIFVRFGAPDLAMTQFLIETLMVILFVLVLYHICRAQPDASTRPQHREHRFSGVPQLGYVGRDYRPALAGIGVYALLKLRLE